MRYEVHPLTVWQSAYRADAVATAKVSYRVVDTHTVRHSPRDGVRAWSYDEAVARQVCDMLNGVNNHAAHWQAEAHKWQGCLDMANRNATEARAEVFTLRNSLGAAKRGADRVRNQLFEAREQRDEARADARLRTAELKRAREEWGCDYSAVSKVAVSRCLGVPMADHVERLEAFKAARQNDAIGWSAEEVTKLIQDRDEAKVALKASHREIAEARQYWANQGPHDHVVISLAEYNKLVKQRDSAVAERDALEKELMQVCSYRAIDGKWIRTS